MSIQSTKFHCGTFTHPQLCLILSWSVLLPHLPSPILTHKLRLSKPPSTFLSPVHHYHLRPLPESLSLPFYEALSSFSTCDHTNWAYTSIQSRNRGLYMTLNIQCLSFWPQIRKSLTSYNIPQLHSFFYIFHFLCSWMELYFIYGIYLHYPFISSGICKLILSLCYCEWTWMWMYLLAGYTVPHI